MKNLIFYLHFIILLLFFACSSSENLEDDSSNLTREEKIDFLRNNFNNKLFSFQIPRNSKIQNFEIDEKNKNIELNISKEFSYIPLREESVKKIYSEIKKFLGEDFKDYDLSVRCMNYKLEQLIPNYFLSDKNSYDKEKLVKNIFPRPIEIVQNISKPYKITKGLSGKNICLWHSHGWYYDVKDKRWRFQRPRLFEMVEDLGPFCVTVPYLIPMLENAGALTFIPRERDVQINEVVIDNDNASENYIEIENGLIKWETGEGKGFAIGNPPYPENYNPFLQGTYRKIKSEINPTAEVRYLPEIPETGFYAVYISYVASEENVNDARYTVYHEGGETEFQVNQQIGGDTWLYLGTFKFSSDKSVEQGVVLTNQSNEPGKIISTDAVRFGGGKGIISREGRTSGRPKFVEGARYYLQYAGMPDSLVYNLHKNENDYNDDYKCRGEYLNYLMGAPFGPNVNRNVKGLGIPIDLSLAFHTDAGITRNDTTVGTLLIYSIEDAESLFVFPDGMSRLANRDFADIMQTQIVEDIKSKYDPVWNRRQLMEAQYSEAYRPNIPGVLLELLSHQNFLDMKFWLDPRFRFDVGRALYKSMLKFLSVQNNFEYVVQPLPVTHFSAEFNSSGNIKLNWKPQDDPLEPTAKAKSYVLYTRKNNGDFDNGIIINNNFYEYTNLEIGVIYSFKVTALNEGGESFPSEILSVCKVDNDKKPVLIINAFDRICGPYSIETENFSGFLNNLDAGVPDKFDISFTGAQYDFNPNSKWLNDDAPGHGASYGDYETKIIAGNTFDFPYIHGESIKNCGYSFVSVSDESIFDNSVEIKEYNFVDIILGEEKETHWQKKWADSTNGLQFESLPKSFQSKITEFCNAGGNLFISGAYVGTDLVNKSKSDSNDIKFMRDILKFDFTTNYASKTGNLYSVENTFLDYVKTAEFNTILNDKIYCVEAPDGINPVKESKTLLRYSENNISAGVGYKDKYGVVVFGFPFETILESAGRNELMKAIIKYLNLE